MSTNKFKSRNAWAICTNETGRIIKLTYEFPYDWSDYQWLIEDDLYEKEYNHIVEVKIVRAKSGKLRRKNSPNAIKKS